MASSSSDSEAWMEDLQGWIKDEGKLVTVKDCSRLWRIHVNVAKQRIYAYLQRWQDDIQAIYCLAGTLQESGKKAVKLVKDTNLNAEEKKFSELTSKHLWSLGPGTSLTMMTSLTDTLASDPYMNTFSSIRNKKCVRRESAQLTQRMEFKENQPKKVFIRIIFISLLHLLSLAEQCFFKGEEITFSVYLTGNARSEA